MTRMSKQGKKRALSPRKHKKFKAQGCLKKNPDNHGYKAHENAVEGTNLTVFIGKVK